MGPTLATVALLGVSALLGLGAWAALRRVPRGGALLAASGASLLLVAWIVWGRHRPWVADLLPGTGVAILAGWSLPLAALLMGCAWRALPGPWWRRGGLTLACLATAAWSALGFVLAEPPPTRVAWDLGVCRQTSQSTCTPAAAATLLRAHGVIASEGELAAACYTSGKGTTLPGLVGGLRRHAPAGSRVRAAGFGVDELDRVPLPAIVSVALTRALHAREPRYHRDWGWIVGQPHSVVLFAILPDGRALVGDPATGLERWGPDALRELWNRQVVWIESY